MIDWDRLTELKAEIGEEDFQEVAAIFVEELTEMLSRLAAAPETATGADFHFMRGGAANLGFAGFAAACQDAERALADGEGADLPALQQLYAASLAAVADMLPQTDMVA